MPIFRDNHRQFSKNNPLLGYLLVYAVNTGRSSEVSSEDSRKKLELERDALKRRLETEQDFVERDKINAEIEKIEKEMSELESLPNLLLYGLENNFKELQDQINKEKDLAKRKELEEKKIGCLKCLQSRQRKINSEELFEDAIIDVENDDVILKSIENKTFDYIHIEYLLSTDLKPFFSEYFEGQIAISKEQMITEDFVTNTLRPNKGDLFVEAEDAWVEYQNDNSAHIEKLHGERQQVAEQLGGSGLHINQKNALKERITSIDREIADIKKQADNHDDWVHKYVTGKEREASKVSLLDNIKPEFLDEMKLFFKEARFMHAEKIREYLSDRYTEVFDKFQNKFKKKRKKGDSTAERMEADLIEFKKVLIDQKQDDPKQLKKLVRNLNTAEMQLDMTTEELDEIEANRPQIEADVLRGFTDIETLILEFTPENLGRLKQELINEEFKRRKAVQEDSTIDAKTKYDEREGESRVFQKAIDTLKEFELPNSELKQHLEKVKADLARISEMEPAELQAIKQDLESLGPKIELVKNLNENIDKALDPENNDARMAHTAIIELESATNIEEIEHILNRNQGSEHINFVSSSDFEQNYREYTPKGFMVVSEVGDEWQIIIDRGFFDNPANFREVKKELIHELLHIEFEKSDDVKKQIRESITSMPEWSRKGGIRDTAIEKFELEGKSPPSGDKWEDDDILSELYAMQNDTGIIWHTGDDVDTRLNNLLVGAGLASSFKDINKNIDDKIRGYEKGIVKKVRGAGGMDAGGDLGGADVAGGSTGSYEEFQNRLKTEGDRIEELGGSEFLSYVAGAGRALKTLQGLHDHIYRDNEDFAKDRENTIFAAGIDDGIKMLKDGVDEVENELGKASAMTPNLEINPLRKLWNNTSFLSVNDMVQVLINVKDFISRRHTRKTNDHAARLGMALFQDTDLGRESYALQQKAEMEEVQEWQSRYENLDGWQLLDEIKKMATKIDPTADQLKAILRLLAQKGRIDWRYAPLWEVLNKLQGKVHLKPKDPVLLHNPPLLRQKLHAALGEIWDYDEYLTLERQNESGYDGELRKYLPSYDRMQDQLDQRLDQLLKMHREGQKVDPMEYESILVYAIENGKAHAENVLFHLMAGMADGLLTQDRGLALDKYLNKWPATQWIYSKKPPLSKKDYEDYCKKYFNDDYKAGSIQGNYGRQFKNFYWVHVQNDRMTLQRVRKSVSEREWDHDWTRSVACIGDANTAKRFFSGKSGQQEAKDTGIENAYAGAVMWLEENAVDPNRIDYRYHFARHAGWIAMSEGIMNRVAYYRGDTDISTRSNDNMENAKAREQGITNHDDWVLRQNRERCRDFLDMIDPDLFGYLRTQKDLRDDDAKKEVGETVKDLLMKKYKSKTSEWETIQHVDDVYEKMDLIIKTIFDTMSNSKIKGIVNEFKVHN